MKWSERYVFPENTNFFEGHFVGNPIVPGVIWLQSVEKSVQKRFPNWRVKKLMQAKFSFSVKPLQCVESLVEITDVTKAIVNFKLFLNENQLVASGKLQFFEEDSL